MGMGLLPVTLLLAGYTLYKGLDWASPKLSKAFGNILYNDKTKKFVQDIYDNKLLRHLTGITTKLDKDDYKSNFGWVCANIWNILKMCVIAFLITCVVKSVAGILLAGICTAEVAAIVTAGILLTRNIIKVLLNRILTLKRKEDKGETVDASKKFFDVMTLFSIMASIGTFVYSTEIGKKIVNNTIKWLWDFGKDNKENADELTAVAAATADKESKSIEVNKDTKIEVKPKTQDPIIKTKDDEILVRNPETGKLHKPSLHNDTNQPVATKDLPKDIIEREYINCKIPDKITNNVEKVISRCDYLNTNNGNINLEGETILLNNGAKFLLIHGNINDITVNTYLPINQFVTEETWIKILTVSQGNNHTMNLIMQFKATQLETLANMLKDKSFDNVDDVNNILKKAIDAGYNKS